MTKLNDYEELYRSLGYVFKNRSLLDEAFTHRGYNQNRYYERLEFLGDRVVNLVVAELLFKRFPAENEGDLAKRHAALVRKEALSRIALQFGMDKYIMLSKYDEAERGNASLLCDICEAVCGAFYIDGGFDLVRDFIVKNWQPMIEEYKTPPTDAKTRLQEWAQGRKLPPPVYEVIGQEGAEHSPVFTVKAEVKGVEPRIGRGGSKREAEQHAAALVIEDIEKGHK